MSCPYCGKYDGRVMWEETPENERCDWSCSERDEYRAGKARLRGDACDRGCCTWEEDGAVITYSAHGQVLT